MPSLPQVEGVVKIMVAGAFPSENRWANIFHASLFEGTPLTNAQFLHAVTGATDITAGSFLDQLAHCMSNQVSIDTIIVQDLGAAAQESATTVAFGGQDTAAPFPPQVSFALSWSFSGARWRGGKPRTYIAGVPIDAVLSGHSSRIDPAFVTEKEVDAQGMISAVRNWGSSEGWNLGFVSYFNKTANPVAPHLRATPLFFNFEDVTIRERLDSQRRRSGKESNFPVGS